MTNLGFHLDTFLFPLSDALQVQLNVKEGGFFGSTHRKVNLGPWSLPVTVTVQSCVISPKLVTAQVHLKKNLWLYVLVDQEGKRIRAVMVNGGSPTLAPRLKHANCRMGDNAEEVAKLILPSVRKYLEYSPQYEMWRTVDAFNLD